MVYEVLVEPYTLQCFITHVVDRPADPSSTDSDWDALGGCEIEFEVWSGAIPDDDGIMMGMSKNECAAVAEQYAEEIEADLWRQVRSQERGVE